jgi:hypothetical protein
LKSIIAGADKMDKRCSFCISKGHKECLLSANDSSRCSECVRLNQSYCDVRGLSSEQLECIAAYHFRLEDELEEAEEERRRADAKVERLRKHKKMWYAKMRRAVARGITDLDELDRVEREEAEAARQAATAQPAEGSSAAAPASLEPVDYLGVLEMDPSMLEFLGPGGVFPQEPLHSQDSQ